MLLEVIHESVIDSLYLIPWLFLTYLLMEFLEHKASHKTNAIIEKSGQAGPLLGGTLGVIPQCGFSVVGSNLFAARVITIGTLISILLSTSDEMLPIMIASGASFELILRILVIKVIISIIAGLVIDRLIKSKKPNNTNINVLCEQEKCRCNKDNIFKSALKHTIKIFIFILVISFFLNLIIESIGKDAISNVLMQDTILGPFIAGIIGLIPSCAGSVLITNLYLSDSVTFGALMAGLLSGAGIGLAVLFRVNKNMKENLKIVAIIFIIGIISGIIIDLIGLF